MIDLWIVGAVSFLTAALATPACAAVARRVGLVDRPAAHKDHARSTPLLGGVALIGTFVAVLLAAVWVGAERSAEGWWLGTIAAVSAMAVLGLIDDRRGLGAGTKLIVQTLIAGGWLLLVSHGGGLQGGWLASGLYSGLALLWIVALTNGFNLLDNMDGLCAGVAAIGSLGVVVLGASSWARLPAVILLGACLGFLVFNFHPATIFLGDAGSLPIGLLLAIGSLEVGPLTVGGGAGWLVAALVVAVPLLDTSLVVVSRRRRGVDPLRTPGTDHLSHRLLRLGASRRLAACVFYAVAALAASAAIVVASRVPMATTSVLVVAATAIAVAVAIIIAFERLPLEA